MLSSSLQSTTSAAMHQMYISSSAAAPPAKQRDDDSDNKVSNHLLVDRSPESTSLTLHPATMITPALLTATSQCTDSDANIQSSYHLTTRSAINIHIYPDPTSLCKPTHCQPSPVCQMAWDGKAVAGAEQDERYGQWHMGHCGFLYPCKVNPKTTPIHCHRSPIAY